MAQEAGDLWLVESASQSIHSHSAIRVDFAQVHHVHAYVQWGSTGMLKVFWVYC